MLTDDAARSIGVAAYYPYVRKVFSDILRALDSQFGRPLMMTNTQNVNKASGGGRGEGVEAGRPGRLGGEVEGDLVKW